eukprot:TRINITY_DN39120_c0_g1_i1.p1 TRINITY_DN39120_c0_g1~~TRINITY_DN39120_c0_g1_i1.p1  ORF type:complete len:470 (+),score=118.78 TRINITY_DN39120_c0_g1_i1:104-1411(+)
MPTAPQLIPAAVPPFRTVQPAGPPLEGDFAEVPLDGGDRQQEGAGCEPCGGAPGIDDSLRAQPPAGSEVGGAPGTDGSSGGRQRVPPDADCLSSGISAGGRYVAGSIKSIVPAVTGVIATAAESTCNYLAPGQSPVGSHAAIDSIKAARTISRTAVITSTHLADSVRQCGTSLGTRIASSAASQVGNWGTPKAVEAGGMLGGAAQRLSGPAQGTKQVFVATVGAVAEVFEASTEATAAVATATREGVVGVVQHKYGSEAGSAVRDGLDILGDVAAVSGAVRNTVAPRSLARTLGGEVGRTAVAQTFAKRTSTRHLLFHDRATGQLLSFFVDPDSGRLTYTVAGQPRPSIERLKYIAEGPVVFFKLAGAPRGGTPKGANLPSGAPELVAALRRLCEAVRVPNDLPADSIAEELVEACFSSKPADAAAGAEEEGVQG